MFNRSVQFTKKVWWMDGHIHTTKVSTILCIVLHSTTITGITLHMHNAFMLTVNSVSQIHGHHQFLISWYILIIKTLQCGKCKSVCLQRVIAWHLAVDLFTLHTTTRQKNIIRTVSAHHRLTTSLLHTRDTTKQFLQHQLANVLIRDSDDMAHDCTCPKTTNITIQVINTAHLNSS